MIELFSRHIKGALDAALDDTPVVVVVGPRQAGKSTLASVVAEERGARYVTLDDEGPREVNVRVHHLRTAGGREIDIVLERGDGSVCGIEVKLGATARTRDFSALRHLQGKLGKRFKAGVVIHTGAEKLRFGPGLWALPVSALWANG